MTLITKRRYFGFALYYIISAVFNGVVLASVMDTEYNRCLQTIEEALAELQHA